MYSMVVVLPIFKLFIIFQTILYIIFRILFQIIVYNMKVVCTERKKIILFFIYSHDKFLALSLLNPLEKNSGVGTGTIYFIWVRGTVSNFSKTVGVGGTQYLYWRNLDIKKITETLGLGAQDLSWSPSGLVNSHSRIRNVLKKKI